MAEAVLLLFLAVVVAVSFFVFSRESRHVEVEDLEGYSALLNEKGEVVRYCFPCQKGEPALFSRFTNALLPVQSYSLGFLSGVCFVLLLTKLLLAAPTAPDRLLWIFLWLCAVAVSWLLVFVAERRFMLGMLRRGDLLEMLQAGSDATAMAAAAYFSMRHHRFWSILTMFAGVIVLSLGDWGIMGTMCVLMIAGLFWRRSQKNMWDRVAPWELEKQVLSFREHLLEGGWIAPAGLLLMLASLGLMYFWNFNGTLLLLMLNGAIVLVVWSEHASRVNSRMLGVGGWQRIFRSRLTGVTVPEAAIQTIS